MLKKFFAEFIGTFTLVFVACGVAAFTGGSLVATSIAFGLALLSMAYSIGRVSGCHINPAVSLGCLVTGRMTLKEFGVYVGAQVLGGFAGAMLLWGVAKMAGVDLAATAASNFCVGSGATFTAGGCIAALLTEIVLTCIFVYLILNVTDEKANVGNLAGLLIALTLTAVHLIGINLTGTSVNPARSIATAFANLIYNGSTDALAQVWMFIVAPLAGAFLAAVLYKALNTEKN